MVKQIKYCDRCKKQFINIDIEWNHSEMGKDYCKKCSKNIIGFSEKAGIRISNFVCDTCGSDDPCECQCMDDGNCKHQNQCCFRSQCKIHCYCDEICNEGK